eukprot:CAMPEP_0118913898 /NCGR_PEP_ID=MMETSP1166-20130328/14492_1 /TAXON_ID=1104430 /ORGANISM="Chrysoreinhardia sp, Strain CCMP3193" /LENGTH=764 /DNA_ID=CAMNT_0006853463 /DNA_START=85 /DNA_END=2379 /DNA_ORIENTATION=-
MASLLKGPFHFAKTSKYNVIEAGLPPASATAATATAAATTTATGSRPEGKAPAVDASSSWTFEGASAAVTRQAAKVRELKKANASASEIASAVLELEGLRSSLASTGVSAAALELNKKVFDDTMIRKMFVVPSFEIHGGVSGLFDLGPPGSALKANVVEAWRRHFVLEEKMLEMECTCLTPEAVLKTSGHVDRFTDLMVKDLETGDCYRADKLLEDAIDDLLANDQAINKLTPEQVEGHRRVQRQADAFTPAELDAELRKYGVKAPATGNAVSPCFPFNLMFGTKIGPSGALTGYLRPETAQGLFVNFKRLLDYNNGRVPFAAAQIGLGFRNEISPKNGLLRVREFTMAEIEHFVQPSEKKHHPKFADVADVALVLFDRESQLGSGSARNLTAREAVREGVVDNETLCYFMTRTYLFCLTIGVHGDKIRFRQHLKTEMAHYAADCWDLEILTAYGWIECAGHADRACYDLQVHAKATNVVMEAHKMLDAPKTVEAFEVVPNRKLVGTTFKKDQSQVYALLEALDDAGLKRLQEDLEAKGVGKAVLSPSITVTKDMVSVKRVAKQITVEKFVPSVIEPSFGIGRILHALLEHSFAQREEDEQRVVMRFKANVAPIKCLLCNLQSNAAFVPIVANIESLLTKAAIAAKTDTSGQSVGRRYARADEIGIPFGVTVDFTTLDDHTVTLRDRDSMGQVRLPIADLVDTLRQLCGAHPGEVPTPWHQATAPFPKVTGSGPSEEQKQPTSNVVIERTPRASFSRPAVSLLN